MIYQHFHFLHHTHSFLTTGSVMQHNACQCCLNSMRSFTQRQLLRPIQFASGRTSVVQLKQDQLFLTCTSLRCNAAASLQSMVQASQHFLTDTSSTFILMSNITILELMKQRYVSIPDSRNNTFIHLHTRNSQ